jgi:hypothetical protein
VIEGLLPLLAPFYHVQRLALGATISIITGILCAASPSSTSAANKTTIDPHEELDADDESEMGALGLSVRPNLDAFKALSAKLGEENGHLSVR